MLRFCAAPFRLVVIDWLAQIDWLAVSAVDWLHFRAAGAPVLRGSKRPPFRLAVIDWLATIDWLPVINWLPAVDWLATIDWLPAVDWLAAIDRQVLRFYAAARGLPAAIL